MRYFCAGLVFWLINILYFVIFRYRSPLHKRSVKDWTWKDNAIYYALCTAVILVCTIPMAFNPIYNGERPEWRNQYEVMAESLMEGHLYLDYEVDPKLAAMENPYDPAERQAQGVSFHWDHAFYKGKYYMYFGIVPVLLVFLPYRALTGQPLTTYHATQLFAALTILCVFLLFKKIADKFFPAVPSSILLTMAASLSVISIWVSINQPALYCTAIIAGVCLEIWSLYYYIDAVYFEISEKKQIAKAFIGALFGALVFGCRPSVALANFVAVPLVIVFLKQRKFSWKVLGELVLVITPYIIVGIALAAYNYVRFDSIMEFGQTYQLTSADQHLYQAGNTNVSIKAILGNFFEFNGFNPSFPYLKANGAFVNFPILLTGFLVVFRRCRDLLVKNRLICLVAGLIASALLITYADVRYAPWLLERYRMDIYFLMGLWSFLCMCSTYESMETEAWKNRSALLISILSYLAMAVCFLLMLDPDSVGGVNLTEAIPELFDKIIRVLRLGF